jgi:hypothetical protein
VLAWRDRHERRGADHAARRAASGARGAVRGAVRLRDPAAGRGANARRRVAAAARGAADRVQQLGAQRFCVRAWCESDQRRQGQGQQQHEPDPLDARLPAFAPHDRRPYARRAHLWARLGDEGVT